MNRKQRYTGMSALASLILSFLLFITGCDRPPDNHTGKLAGTVMFGEVDLLSGSPTGTMTPVVREVLVYEPTTTLQVTPAPSSFGPLYSEIHSRLVATTTSDSNGRFSMVLPEGTYSLFVRENGQYYANIITDAFIYPVDVVSGATTTVTFEITSIVDNHTGALAGTVRFWEGNFTPGSSTGTITPVVREVLVYEPTTTSQVTLPPPYFGPFFSAIHSRLVATTMSDSYGRFSMVLPAGTYSMFVRENGQYYSNIITDAFIYPVDVVSGATTTITFNIDYMAAF
jgi:hypothetical protein